MYSKTFTFFSKPPFIVTECHISKGVPSFNIIGLPSKSIQESKDRIKSALNSVGITLPPKKITINLNPVDVTKQGNHFDLPIAVSILKAMDYLKLEDNIILAGEISLSGSILPVRGILNYILNLRDFLSNYSFLILPLANKDEISILKNYLPLKIKFISSLSEIFNIEKISICNDFEEEKIQISNEELSDLFNDIRGQDLAKYALAVSVSGKHNVLMIGPPGTGKSILSKSALCLFPPPTEREFIEIAQIYNLAGYDFNYWIKFKKVRPYRNPHHTSSYASIVGGSKDAKLGEVTLAHKGVLFLDEFPEFNRSVIESLREPLETKKIVISRVESKAEYPCDFLLIAAMNPCPCGYYKTNIKECTCYSSQISKYWSKISGPIIDRIDIFIEVSNISFEEASREKNTTHQYYLNLIYNSYKNREKRNQTKSNSELSIEEINEYCLAKLTSQAKGIIEKIYEKQKLSIRKFHKILKISRTIADINLQDQITENSILNAYKLSINRYLE
ncbi:MAG: YifB family Mg chelatase-like AAA ATPase [bacterium]|nr:YifB family Mg chelatase-like AAA ATPase [bacterium]